MDLSKTKTAEAMNSIVDRFISKNSACQINIDSALQSKIIDTANKFSLQGINDLGVFDEALNYVSNIVQRDTLQRFKISHGKPFGGDHHKDKDHKDKDHKETHKDAEGSFFFKKRTSSDLTNSNRRRSLPSLPPSHLMNNSPQNSAAALPLAQISVPITAPISTTSNPISAAAASSPPSLSSSPSSSPASTISKLSTDDTGDDIEDLRNSWYRGHLLRRKGFFGNWKPFTYTKKGRYLFEFKPGANHVTSEPLETIFLENCLVEPAKTLTGKAFSFILNTHDGKSYFFQACSNEEMNEWVEELSYFSVSKANLRFTKRNSINSDHSSGSDLHPSDSSSTITGSTTNSAVFSDTSSQASVGYIASNLSTLLSLSSNGSSMSISSPSVSSYNGEQPLPPQQQASLEGDALYQALPILNFLESFTDAVIVSDSRGVIVAFNSSGERMFRYTKVEAVGQPLKILMPDPYASLHDGYLFRHEKHGEEKLIGKTRNLKGLRKGGDVFDLQISLGKLPLKGYYIATIREKIIGEED